MNRITSNLVLTAFLAAAACVAVFFFNRAAAPEEKVLPATGISTPDFGAVVDDVTEASLRRDLKQLCLMPSRFSGSSGCEVAADYIERELDLLGYEIIEQPFTATVPVTRYTAIAAVDGKVPLDVEINAMLPNWFRTVTTPPEGLTGIVHVGRKGLAQEFEGVQVKDNIVLLPLGVSWDTIAGMGAAAVLYYDDGESVAGAQWPHHRDASMNIPRFLIRGDAIGLAGRRITISARVDFEIRSMRNVIGVLRGGNANEAVVISSFYDAYSYTPDAAPGASQACSPAVFLAVARQLARQQGDLQRSIVLAATAGHGQGLFGIREFVRSLGVRGGQSEAVREAEDAQAALKAALAMTEETLQIAVGDEYWDIANHDEEVFWRAKGAKVQDTFMNWYKAALDSRLMAAIEGASQRRVDWVRAGMPVNSEVVPEDSLFTAYKDARRRQQHMEALMATPPGRSKKLYADELTELDIRGQIRKVGEQRALRLRRRSSEATGRLAVAREMAEYRQVLFLGLDLTAVDEPLALVCGSERLAANCMPADNEVMALLRAAGNGLDAADDGPLQYVRDAGGVMRTVNLVREQDEVSLPFVGQSPYGAYIHFESTSPLWAGHTAFTLTASGGSRRLQGTAFDTLDRILEPRDGSESKRLPLVSLARNARLIAGLAALLGHGHGQIIPVSVAPDIHTIRGEVVSRLGEDLTPRHPLAGAIIRFSRSTYVPSRFSPGVGNDIVLTADEDGRFELPAIWSRALSIGYRSPIDIDAAVVDPVTGEVRWTLSMNDSGPNKPYTVRSVRIDQYRTTLAKAVLFRAAAVEAVPMIDPATLRPYTSFDFIDAKRMAEPRESKIERSGNCFVCFVPPETRLFFTFKKGSMLNPNLTTVRAFALGAEGMAARLSPGDAEISGRGYLAADHPRIANIEIDAALSMAQVNTRRLKLQEQYKMADDMSLRYNSKAVSLADTAQDHAAAGRTFAARQSAAKSVAYSSNIHPVIRKNAADAIWGILFYLLLALPFAIFLEKLLVGHPDTRYQICYQGVIFVLFFLALRAVHPAYQLVRSSYMILLGFITFALAVMVGIFISARFSSNVKDLQQRLHKRADVGEVSRAGAMMTAFPLGLGHMRRRKVRTGLTIVTLVLITFVMLCFTSITTDETDVHFAVGKAPYTGLFIRGRSLGNVEGSLGPLRERYDRDHLVVPRRWAGTFQVVQSTVATRSRFAIAGETGGRRVEAVAHAIMGLSPAEPRVSGIDHTFFSVLKRWFETETEHSCFLPSDLAAALQITSEQVCSGNVTVTIGGEPFTVLGIFREARMNELLDLDGESMLPLDVLGLIQPGMQSRSGDELTDVPENSPRLPAESVVIVPVNALPGEGITASIAIAFQDVGYEAARKMIDSHLEQSAEPAYYGIEGVAFYGGTFRMQSVAGMLGLILPIIIVALTVLNTMRGSVYERRNELYVFNAVGLSPTHIRWLFLAEASVYAVVGAVGGYLLAQGVGTAMRVFDVTGGLTMNYSSMSSIVITIIIMAVVLFSSFFPARMASELAAPAETMIRERHTSDGDIMEIDLPFTFNRRDRVAIVPYFFDWFENFGEGSAGEYFCSPPDCSVAVEDHGPAAPRVRTRTWLKPYDLGISQDVELIVRHQPETGDHIATVVLTRRSGDLDSWERCCHAFIGLLRKRFLTWRAVTEEQRDELLVRGRALLSKG